MAKRVSALPGLGLLAAGSRRPAKWGALLFGDFLLGKQEKVTSCRATPGQPTVGHREHRQGLRRLPLTPAPLPASRARGEPSLHHWHASHVGSSIEQNFTSVAASTAAACVLPPAEFTAFNSPPRPVDFSAEVAPRVRR